MKKLIIPLLLFAFVLMPTVALAQIPPELGGGSVGDIDAYVGQSDDVDLKETIVNIINWILGFLALIAIIIILIGGFEWMTAGGSEDKVTKARARLKYGLIGLAIILLAYLIVSVIFTTILDFGVGGEISL